MYFKRESCLSRTRVYWNYGLAGSKIRSIIEALSFTFARYCDDGGPGTSTSVSAQASLETLHQEHIHLIKGLTATGGLPAIEVCLTI